jgi:outer membrane lipoprotein carrier protein
LRCTELGLLLLLATVAHAGDVPPLLAKVETKYAAAATMTADFTQLDDSKATGTKKTSSGRIAFKRPDKLRWETLKPDANLLVSDGHTFWFYTPPFDEGDKGQLIERKSSQAQSKLAQALLSGRFSMAKDMKFARISDSEYSLTPKRGQAGTVKLAQVVIDPKTELIEKVILVHTSGNRSEIALSAIQLGGKLEDSRFRFTAPAGTDQVTE